MIRDQYLGFVHHLQYEWFFKKQFLPWKLAENEAKPKWKHSRKTSSIMHCTSGCTFGCDISKDTGQFPELHSNLETLFWKTERLEGRSFQGNKELSWDANHKIPSFGNNINNRVSFLSESFKKRTAKTAALNLWTIYFIYTIKDSKRMDSMAACTNISNIDIKVYIPAQFKCDSRAQFQGCLVPLMQIAWHLRLLRHC